MWLLFVIVVFTEAGIDPILPLTTMCGSGMSSCSLLLAAHECGNTSAAAVYDVSLTTVDILFIYYYFYFFLNDKIDHF